MKDKLSINEMLKLEEMLNSNVYSINLSDREVKYLNLARKLPYHKVISYLDNLFENPSNDEKEDDYINMQNWFNVDEDSLLERLEEVNELRQYKRKMLDNILNDLSIEKIITLEKNLYDYLGINDFNVSNEELIALDLIRRIPYDFLDYDISYFKKNWYKIKKYEFFKRLMLKYDCSDSELIVRIMMIKKIKKFQQEEERRKSLELDNMVKEQKKMIKRMKGR